MRITVFTPAYNRGYIIEKLYRSLQQQSFRNFEWVVVNDGSTDNTQELLEQYVEKPHDFPIRYVKTENGGKHRAINLGVELARGELFLIVDSDDYLTHDALEFIDKVERSIPENQKHRFGGVCGLRGYNESVLIGQTFDGEYLDITMLNRPKHRIFGDKAEVFYTHILRKYPFPEFEGERFLTECVVWDKIATDGYLLRFYNHISIVCTYLADGLTADGYAKYRSSPKGWGLYINQSVQFGKLSGLEKWNTYLKYFYEMRGTMSFGQISKNLNCSHQLLWIGLAGMRLFYKIYDR